MMEYKEEFLTIERGTKNENAADAFAFGWSTVYPFVVLHERKTMPLFIHYKRTSVVTSNDAMFLLKMTSCH